MLVDRKAAEAAISAFLRALGHDVAADPLLAETPARVVDAFASDLLAGYDQDVAALIRAGSTAIPADQEHDFVAIRDLAVTTVCPHHLLPAHGTALVAYAPGALLLGLGTIAHLVSALSRRLSLQEAIGKGIAEALVDEGRARGALCMLSLRHTCLSCRGPRESAASVQSIATAGCFKDPGKLDLYSHLLPLLGPRP